MKRTSIWSQLTLCAGAGGRKPCDQCTRTLPRCAPPARGMLETLAVIDNSDNSCSIDALRSVRDRSTHPIESIKQPTTTGDQIIEPSQPAPSDDLSADSARDGKLSVARSISEDEVYWIQLHAKHKSPKLHFPMHGPLHCPICAEIFQSAIKTIEEEDSNTGSQVRIPTRSIARSKRRGTTIGSLQAEYERGRLRPTMGESQEDISYHERSFFDDNALQYSPASKTPEGTDFDESLFIVRNDEETVGDDRLSNCAHTDDLLILVAWLP